MSAKQTTEERVGLRMVESLTTDRPIWTPKDLADYLSLSVGWVYERTKPSAVDPIPRCPGIGRVRFNTRSRAFQDWLARQIGGDFVDSD